MIKEIVAGVVFGIFALTISTQVSAQQDVIDKRKALMGENNAAVKAIAGAAKEKDYATVQLKAKEIMSGLDSAAGLFPPGS